MTCLGGAVAVLLCSVGTVLAQKSGGILKVYHRENPPSASILEEATASTTVPFMAVFNNLVMYDQEVAQNSPGTIVPDLAKSWAWNTEKTELTFQLQDGVKWHDGKPFTARDVVCTFDLLLDKAPQRLRRNPRKSWFTNVDFVTARSDTR
jgi:peptide/nickel transport system substrate-binding protein